MPTQFKSLAFWKAVSFLLAGAVGIAIAFNLIPAQYGYTGEVILAFIVSILQFFGVNPELRAKGLK